MLYLEDIKKILPHRYPFLLLDRVLELEEGKCCTALKNVTGNEHFFAGHFPGQPIMPGVLIVEAMAQASGIAAFSSQGDRGEQLALFAGIEKARFKKPVFPGDQLIIKTHCVAQKLGTWKFRASASVGEKAVSTAEIQLAVVTASSFS